MIFDPPTAADGNGRDADATDPGDFVNASEATDDCGAHDSSWHGTGVAGLIAANTNDGAWTAGIDWAARILPVRVLGKCGGIRLGYRPRHRVGRRTPVPGVPPNATPAQIINLSLGGEGACPAAYASVAAAAYGGGITRAIVAAAGNEQDDVSKHVPANCPGFYAIASTTNAGNLASYSNSGARIDLSAPGGTLNPRVAGANVLVLSNAGYTIRIRLGIESRAPGRRDFRDLVYVRHLGQGVVAVDDGESNGGQRVRRDALPDARSGVQRDAVRSGGDHGNRRRFRYPHIRRHNDSGTFAYTVNGIQQTKAITRQVFGPLPTCTFGTHPDLTQATNYQDLWWASPAGSESGWGVNFTQQGDIIFATWFTYDVDGTPLWLSATAQKFAPGVYTGTLYRTIGPAFDAVQTKPVTRQVFRAPGTICQ